MSISRQLKEAVQAAAADPNAPSYRRPERGGVAAEPKQPLTQAQLDVRLQVVPVARAVNVEEEQEEGGEGEKKRKNQQRDRDDTSTIKEDVEAL